MKKIVQGVLNKMGIQLKRYPDLDLARRMKIMDRFKIDVVLDIGANAGQYALLLRKLGYKNEIISFEPLNRVFGALERASANDNKWKTHNYALGNENSKCVINVAENSYSSSILNMNQAHLKAAPQSKFVQQQEIEVKRLDSIFNLICQPENRVMIKIDTQGYEKNVIDGAAECLKNITLVQLEMSIIELYENEILYKDMIVYMDKLGFDLISLENGFYNEETGALLQVDGIFVNRKSLDILKN